MPLLKPLTAVDGSEVREVGKIRISFRIEEDEWEKWKEVTEKESDTEIQLEIMRRASGPIPISSRATPKVSNIIWEEAYRLTRKGSGSPKRFVPWGENIETVEITTDLIELVRGNNTPPVIKSSQAPRVSHKPKGQGRGLLPDEPGQGPIESPVSKINHQYRIPDKTRSIDWNEPHEDEVISRMHRLLKERLNRGQDCDRPFMTRHIKKYYPLEASVDLEGMLDAIFTIIKRK